MECPSATLFRRKNLFLCSENLTRYLIRVKVVQDMKWDSSMPEMDLRQQRGSLMNDPCYKVLTRYFDGGVKIGDHISIFKGFQDGVLYQRDPKEWGKHSYELLDGSDGFYLRFYTDDKGYIVYMFYIEPV